MGLFIATLFLKRKEAWFADYAREQGAQSWLDRFAPIFYRRAPFGLRRGGENAELDGSRNAGFYRNGLLPPTTQGSKERKDKTLVWNAEAFLGLFIATLF